jgi:hypothetical protein
MPSLLCPSHLAAVDQSRSRNDVVGGAKGARRDQGRAGADEAGDAMVMHASEDPSVSSCPGRLHPRRQGDQPVKIN